MKNPARKIRNNDIGRRTFSGLSRLGCVVLILCFTASLVCAQPTLRFTPPVFASPSETIDIPSPVDQTPMPGPTGRTTVRFGTPNSVLPIDQVSPSTLPSFSSETLSSNSLRKSDLSLQTPTTTIPDGSKLRFESIDSTPVTQPTQLSVPISSIPNAGLFARPLPPSVPVDRNELLEVMQIGRQLEAESRWSDVLTHYETALRIYRNDNMLMERFRLARFHYDLGRRFNDSSYLNKIHTISFVDSLMLFDEIISRIQTNYVEALDWDKTFRYGLQDIEISLNDPFFRKKVGLSVPIDRIEAYVVTMRKMADGWEIRNQEDLKNGILHLAELAMKQLNLNPVVMLMEFTCGVVNSLDPYTAYLTPNQYSDTISMISGNFVGLGVELKSDRESLLIVRVIQGSPAQESGLRDGDRIHFVDGVPTKGKDTDNAADLLQGIEGTTVKLLIQHAGERESREISIVRRKIDVPSVEDVRMLTSELGYVKLTGFQSKTCKELKQAIAQLDRQGMQCLVLDLRHNPGGLLQIGVEVANLFIEEGAIVRTKGRHNSMDTPYMATKENTLKIPLIVLIDEESASASEIVAGAIRDHGRGKLIGNRSYGKGTIQAILPVHGGQTGGTSVGLRLTVEKFYSPLGWPYSGVGVEPHVKVDSEKKMSLARQIQGRIQIPIVSRTVSSAPNDPFIQKAIDVSRDMIGTSTALRN